jgi:alcohol dehydrogenase
VLRADGHPGHQFGHHPQKLQIVEAAGAVVNPETKWYEFVVDATGSPEGLRQAVSMTQPRGTLILKSTVHGAVGFDTAPVIVNEITLVGSRCGRFEAALPLLDVIDVEPLIQARYPLRDAPAAFAHAARRGTLKVLLT